MDNDSLAIERFRSRLRYRRLLELLGLIEWQLLALALDNRTATWPQVSLGMWSSRNDALWTRRQAVLRALTEEGMRL